MCIYISPVFDEWITHPLISNNWQSSSTETPKGSLLARRGVPHVRHPKKLAWTLEPPGWRTFWVLGWSGSIRRWHIMIINNMCRYYVYIYIYPIVYHCIKVVTSELWPVPLQIQPGASFLSRWWTCWDQRFFRGGWKTLWPCLITAVTWPKNKIKHQLKTVKDDEVVRLLTKNLWLIMSDKLVRMNQILN